MVGQTVKFLSVPILLPLLSYQIISGVKEESAFGLNRQASICADQLPVFLPGAASPKSPVASLIPITAFLTLARSHASGLFSTKISILLLPSDKTI